MSPFLAVAIIVAAVVTIVITWVSVWADENDKLDRLLDLDTPTPDELVREYFDVHDEEDSR